MKFQMVHHIWKSEKEFTDTNGPSWLCEGGLAGSTMDNRWFWEKYVLGLAVGQSVDTDFHTITRIE